MAAGRTVLGKDAEGVLSDCILGPLFSKAVVEQERCKQIPSSAFLPTALLSISENKSLTLKLGTLSYFLFLHFIGE